MSARSAARRRWVRLGRRATETALSMCACRGQCPIDSLVKTEAGCAYCPKCDHVLGRDIVRGLHAARALARREQP